MPIESMGKLIALLKGRGFQVVFAGVKLDDITVTRAHENDVMVWWRGGNVQVLGFAAAWELVQRLLEERNVGTKSNGP